MHKVTPDDRRFIADLAGAAPQPHQFDHRAHVRAAYNYLATGGTEDATVRMRDTLLAFLRRHGADAWPAPASPS